MQIERQPEEIIYRREEIRQDIKLTNDKGEVMDIIKVTYIEEGERGCDNDINFYDTKGHIIDEQTLEDFTEDDDIIYNLRDRQN